MRLAAVVILYNPGKGVISNILSYLNHFEKVYVIDNTEESKADIRQTIEQLRGTEYIHDGENKGIAARLNEVCRISIEDGFNWLLTMDQDSFFKGNNIISYISCMQAFDDLNEVSIIGVEYIIKGTDEATCNAIAATSLITSGSMLNLKLFDLVGGFDEALFIDQVDFEYCYRSIVKNYQVIQFKNVFLDHLLGETSVHKSLKSLKKTNRSLHSPLRLYYMTRNYLYIRSKYKKNFSNDISRTRKDLLNRIKNNVLYGKERITVVQMILKGVIDYKNKKMGKI